MIWGVEAKLQQRGVVPAFTCPNAGMALSRNRPRVGNFGMDQWSDATKFWAESLRTAVFGIIGAIAATVLLGRYADSREHCETSGLRQLKDF